MAKNILQDIQPLSRKNIPNMESEAKPVAVEKVIHFNEEENDRYEHHQNGPHHKRNIILWSLAGVSIMVFLIAMSALYSRASVSVIPKSEKPAFDSTFTAARDAGGSADFAFQVMSVDDTETKTLTATATQQVSTKATGTVVIYNETGSPQKLIATTRLATSDGKIFRIPKAVIVPAASVQGGKSVPGSVEVGVAADAAGADYNIGLSDFTIPGFEGDPRYKTIYARSKTTMAGGASGTVHVASADDMTAARNDLIKTLTEKLDKEYVAQIPKGYVAYPNATILKVADADLSGSPDANVPVTVTGTLHVFLLPVDSFTTAIAAKAIDTYDNSPVTIENIKDLDVSIENGDSITDPLSVKTISLAVKGDPEIVYSVDQDKIVGSLLGKNKSDFDNLMSAFPSVFSASLSIHPFWVHTIPESADKIAVAVADPFAGK